MYFTYWNCPFYPRPVLAFGYCRCLRLCVCPCVCQSVRQSLACPRNNSGPVQARITKFGPKMQKTLVKVPIVFGGNWPWPSRSNLISHSEFTPFWACPHHNSLPIQARITKFGPEVQNSLLKIPIVTGDPLHSRAACTQPCNVNTHSGAHCSPGARLCEQWGHGCVNNRARLCASARLCRGSPVIVLDGNWPWPSRSNLT